MSRTPSNEVSAIRALPPEPEPEDDGVCPYCGGKGCLRCAAPPWAKELLEQLERQGRRLDRQDERLAEIERTLHGINGNLGVLGNAYKIQAQDIALLRQHCPHCPQDVVSTSGD